MLPFAFLCPIPSYDPEIIPLVNEEMRKEETKSIHRRKLSSGVTGDTAVKHVISN